MKERRFPPALNIALLAAVIGAVAFFLIGVYNRSDLSTTTQADVNEIQREMRQQTPKGLEEVPPEKATAGVRMMGGKH